MPVLPLPGSSLGCGGFPCMGLIPRGFPRQLGCCQVVQAGQHLGHDAAFHLPLGGLALGGYCVHFICTN